MNIKSKAVSFSKYLAVFFAGLSFSAGLVFAWNAVWHGTDWIKSGAVIDAKKIAENFEYLYQKKVDKTEVPDCQGKNKWLQYNKSQEKFICYEKPAPRGCKLRYKIKTSQEESDWGETNWGTQNNGDWIYGDTIYAKGSANTVSYKIGIQCDEHTNLELGYRYRGNHGPYGSSNVGNYSYDGKVQSGTDGWTYGDYTQPFSKSCNSRGGNGGCGMVIREITESGTLNCDTMIKFAGNNWSPGYEYNTFGSFNYGCGSTGCSMQMAIRCY